VTKHDDAQARDGADKDEPENGSESLTRLIAPVFAAFSLPTIVTLSSSTQPWHDAVLALLIAATGLFMASMQFSIGTLYDKYKSKRAQKVRAGLTLFGLAFVALALFFEVYPVLDSGWLWLPLIVLLVGGLGPAAWILRIDVLGRSIEARRRHS
jgi:MFS family permease